MVLVITRDCFLLTAIKYLLPDENVIHLTDSSKIKIEHKQNVKIIVDNYYNNVMHTTLVSQLVFLFPERVIIFSGFNIKLLFMGVKVIYLSRKTTPDLIVNAMNGLDVGGEGLIRLTRKQHYILTEVASGKRSYEIANNIKTSVKTIDSHINQMKKILQIRRVRCIAMLREYKYLITK